MIAYIGCDRDNGLISTADLLHVEEKLVYADSGYQTIKKRPEIHGREIGFRTAMR
jgi:IS5 family transposase